MDTPFVLNPPRCRGLCSYVISQGRGFYAQELSVVAFPYVRIRDHVFILSTTLLCIYLAPSRSQREKEAWNREREPDLEAARFLSCSFSLGRFIAIFFYGNGITNRKSRAHIRQPILTRGSTL